MATIITTNDLRDLAADGIHLKVRNFPLTELHTEVTVARLRAARLGQGAIYIHCDSALECDVVASAVRAVTAQT